MYDWLNCVFPFHSFMGLTVKKGIYKQFLTEQIIEDTNIENIRKYCYEKEQRGQLMDINIVIKAVYL